MTALPVRQPSERGRTALEWCRANRDEVVAMLVASGGCLVRGTPDVTAAVPELVLAALCVETMTDVLWSTPRTLVKGATFTATEYSARATIDLHSELAYAATYPRLLCFHCIEPASVGGETTLADLDELSESLGGATADVIARGVVYVRHLRRGLDIDADTVLAMTDGVELDEGPGGFVRVRRTGRGGLRVPRAPNALWFNQIVQFHPAALPDRLRHRLAALYGSDAPPRTCTFGDGTTIPDEFVRDVRRLSEAGATQVKWRAGDVLILDNLRHVHGRRPFTGRRQLQVAVGLPSRSDERQLLDALLD